MQFCSSKFEQLNSEKSFQHWFAQFVIRTMASGSLRVIFEEIMEENVVNNVIE